MALNILQQPNQHIPAYNDIIYVVTSTNNAQANFNYLATLYIGSDTITLKAPADPTYGSGVFNFGRIVENYLTSDIAINETGFQLNSNSNKSFYVKIGEEYGVSSGVTQYPNLYTSETRYAWNGITDYLHFQSYSQNGYLLDLCTRTFNSSGTQYIETNQDAFQYYATKDVVAGLYLVVKTYDSSDNLLQTAAIQNSFQTSGTVSHHFVRANVGTRALNNSTLISGSQPVITDSVSYYTVEFQGTPYNSHVYRYNIVSPDCRYPTYRLHYLNELGAFESFNFTKISKKSVSIIRSKFKAPIGGLTSASSYGYNKSDRGYKNHFIELKDGLKLTTDYLTDASYAQLEQLISSPEIYLEDDTNGLIPIMITDNNYELKTSLNDKIFRLEINVEYGYNRYKQRS